MYGTFIVSMSYFNWLECKGRHHDSPINQAFLINSMDVSDFIHVANAFALPFHPPHNYPHLPHAFNQSSYIYLHL